MRAHPVRGSGHLQWVVAGILALLVLLWVGDCFGDPTGRRFAAPTLIETPYAPASYTRLLREYVVPVQVEGGANSTRFDYQRLHADKTQAACREEIRKRFLSVDPETLDPTTRTAWAVNAYNFLVIDAVLDYMTETGRYWLKSIKDIGEKEFAVFDEKRIPLGKKTWTLNEFEHHFLFHDIDRETGRSEGPVDPRLHFVLVCAAVGCPPLRTEPLHPEHLDRDLDEATRNALRSPLQLRLEGETLHVSKLFEWYRADFGEAGIREFLLRYAPEEARRALADPDRVVEIIPDIEWIWLLNRP